MALCCIGGVCVPYSALVPLLLYGLRWVLQKLAAAGLLPPAVAAALARFLPSSSSCCEKKQPRQQEQQKQLRRRRSKVSKQDSLEVTRRTTASSCCSDEDDGIQTLETEEELTSLLSMSDQAVILKFTATWCKPCKQIQPVYEELASDIHNKERLRFAVADADELDEAAGRYGVVALPAFVAVRAGKVVDKYAGSDETKLREFVEKVTAKTK